MNLMFWIVTLIPAMFVLWVLFVNVMWLKHVGQKKYTSGWKKYVFYAFGYPIVLVGVLWDAFFNITWGSMLFLEFPHIKRLLLTARMQHIIKNERHDRWRWKLAVWICRYLVEPWDKNHCGLEDIK